jgi:hypothetical protein
MAFWRFAAGYAEGSNPSATANIVRTRPLVVPRADSDDGHARNRGTAVSALAQLTVRVRGVPLHLDAGHPALLHDDP